MSPPADAAADPALQTIDLTRGFSRAAVAPRATAPFSLVGATWTDPGSPLRGTVQVRTRSVADGSWTGWQSLEADAPNPAEPGSRDADGARGSTDPLWVGPSDGIETRVATSAGTLPAGLRVDLINPGARPGITARRAPERPVPNVISRAQWGANEWLVKAPPEYTADVQAVFVHHTAGTNSYSCADSAAIIRGIQAYQVKSKHWNDIGYNFLVDKCGTLFEGRAGGVDQPVLGAHTMGFNSHTSAIAVLGNFGAVGVNARVKTVIAQVAAYKLGTYGRAPGGRAALVSSGSDRYPKGSTAILRRVSGHRDTGRTECPGNTLYAQIPSIRGIAAAAPAALTVTKITGANQVGDTFYTQGSIRPYWTVDTATTLMSRYDILVDDVLVASLPATEGQQVLRLEPGRHVVRIRAVALNNRVTVTDLDVVADETLPDFTSGPSVSLRSGSLNGIVPVRMRWAARDAGGLAGVALTSPVAARLDPATTVWAGSVKPSTGTTYALRATDRAGNARSVAAARTPVVVPEDRAARTGTWRTVRNPGHLGGTALRSTTVGASLNWTFTGRSAALAMARTAASGEVKVSVDGAAAGTVDLRSADTAFRRAVWTRSWGSSATHTVTIEVTRPGVISDGLVYLTEGVR